MTEQKLEERIRSYVKLKGGRKIVNWQAIENLRYEGKHALYEDCVKSLINLDILSEEADGNFYLSMNEININPKLPLRALYFTREEDAREYKRVSCSGAMHPVSIRKIKVIE